MGAVKDLIFKGGVGGVPPPPCRDLLNFDYVSTHLWNGSSRGMWGFNWSDDGVHCGSCDGEGGLSIGTFSTPFLVSSGVRTFYSLYESSCGNRTVWINRAGTQYAAIFNCNDGDGIRAWRWTTPWTPDTNNPLIGTSSGFFPLTTGLAVQDINPYGIEEGTRLWTCDWNAKTIVQWDMAIPFNYDGGNLTKTATVTASSNNPRDLCWNEDGLILYVMTSGSQIRHFDCPNPYDITGMVALVSSPIQSEWTKEAGGMDIQWFQDGPPQFNTIDSQDDQYIDTWDAPCL